MKAKVTLEFPGRPDSEVMTRAIVIGEVIEGDLARVAIENNWAEAIAEDGAEDGIEGGDGAGDASQTLESLTVAQLKALATEKGIDLGDASKKDDIVAVIQSAIDAAAAVAAQ